MSDQQSTGTTRAQAQRDLTAILAAVQDQLDDLTAITEQQQKQIENLQQRLDQGR